MRLRNSPGRSHGCTRTGIRSPCAPAGSSANSARHSAPPLVEPQ